MSEAPALFGVEEVRPARPATVGVVERALQQQLETAYAAKLLIRDDVAALAESAMVLARTMDTADAIGGMKGGYLAAQTQPALQKALHALRLPTEVAPPAVPRPGDGQPDTPSWVSDAFGTPE